MAHRTSLSGISSRSQARQVPRVATSTWRTRVCGTPIWCRSTRRDVTAYPSFSRAAAHMLIAERRSLLTLLTFSTTMARGSSTRAALATPRYRSLRGSSCLVWLLSGECPWQGGPARSNEPLGMPRKRARSEPRIRLPSGASTSPRSRSSSAHLRRRASSRARSAAPDRRPPPARGGRAAVTSAPPRALRASVHHTRRTGRRSRSSACPLPAPGLLYCGDTQHRHRCCCLLRTGP